MSVINKALQNLEQRSAGNGLDEAMPAYVHAANTPSSSRRVVMPTVALLGAAAVVAGGWIVLRDKAPAVAPQQVAARAVPPTAQPAAVPAAAVPAPAAPAAPVVQQPSTPAVVAPPSPPPTRPAIVAAATVTAPVQPAPVPAAAVQPAPPAMPARTAADKPATPAVAAATPAAMAAAKPAPAASVAPAPVKVAAAPAAEMKPAAAETKPAAAETKPAAAAPAAKPAPATAVAAAPAETAPAPASTPSTAAAPIAVARASADARLEKTVSPQQQSDNFYKEAVRLMQQGNGIEARDALRKALQANAANSSARIALAGLLVEGHSLPDADSLLRDGVKISPERLDLWMQLARVQLEQMDTAGATSTMERGMQYAGDDAQFHAFYAALAQRGGRHDDSVKHYLVALRSDPAAPTWLVGIGISLQALGKDADALEAYQRARNGGRLREPLAGFVEQRVEQLKR